MKLCIDPGHGMSNRKPGLWDPGCEGSGLKEAEIVLVWAEELRRAVEARGIPAVLTRRDQVTPCPVGERVKLAEAAHATHFLSIHVNQGDDSLAHGTETLYRFDPEFAREVQTAALSCLGLRDRGLKQRTDLAVLHFKGPAALLELGFIDNPVDVRSFTSNPLMLHTCRAIAAIF